MTLHTAIGIYITGVACFPILLGISGKLTCKQRHKSSPERVAVVAFLWPFTVYGVVASTIIDTIANS